MDAATKELNFGSSLSNITNIVNKFVVSPIASFGVAGFIFDVQGESTANLSADITDHYTEDNTAIQDQIAIHPKRITLKGYVGELTYSTNGNSPTAINTLGEKLVAITAFAPTISSSAAQIQQAIKNPIAAEFTGLLGTASNIYGLIKNGLGAFGATQHQQNAYNYFKALMQSGTLMGIQTPWEFMTSMAIESITAVQPENSIWITDFSVTFKEIRIASTQSIAQSNASAQTGVTGVVGSQSTPAVLNGAANIQQSPTTNLGTIAGALSPTAKAFFNIAKELF